MVILASIFLILASLSTINCFVPAKLLDVLFQKLDTKAHMNMGIVSASLSHDEITRRGLIRSVARYLHDQRGGENKIQLDNMDRYLNNLNLLYSDSNGGRRSSRPIELEFLLNTEILPYVTLVDVESSTRDMPYAHFDAETLAQSNRRVIEMTARVQAAVRARNMAQARKLAGQVLHTIQDFYSHSNWIEMGNWNRINSAIGSTDFVDRQPLVAPRDANLCRSNCQLVRVECSDVFVRRLVDLVRLFKPNSSRMIKCPIEYYKCTENMAVLDRLLSGYFSNQKLDDGTPVVNPGSLWKCNHGGLFDSDSSTRSALGGINKDSGMYVLSPHAHLHLQAARLAELHTEYFFGLIRSRVGDQLFAQFLKIN